MQSLKTPRNRNANPRNFLPKVCHARHLRQCSEIEPGVQLLQRGQVEALEPVAGSASIGQEESNVFMSHPENHDFRCLDERGRGLTGFQIHFARRLRRDRSDLLLADRNHHLRHQSADAYALDPSDQLISVRSGAHDESRVRLQVLARVRNRNRSTSLCGIRWCPPAVRTLRIFLLYIHCLMVGKLMRSSRAASRSFSNSSSDLHLVG